MLLLGIGIGAVGAFVVMTVAACLGAHLIVRVQEPLPQFDSSDIQLLSADEKTRRNIERGLADHDKYLHALEAISTLHATAGASTASRIARQALGKGWVA